jgi:hypothetical protein
VATRLILDEFNLNLSPLTATLLIIVIVVVTCCRHSGTLGASRLEPVAGEVVTWGRMVEGVRVSDVGHVDDDYIFYGRVDGIGKSTKSRLGCRDFDERGNLTVWVWC